MFRDGWQYVRTSLIRIDVPSRCLFQVWWSPWKIISLRKCYVSLSANSTASISTEANFSLLNLFKTRFDWSRENLSDICQSMYLTVMMKTYRISLVFQSEKVEWKLINQNTLIFHSRLCLPPNWNCDQSRCGSIYQLESRRVRSLSACFCRYSWYLFPCSSPGQMIATNETNIESKNDRACLLFTSVANVYTYHREWTMQIREREKNTQWDEERRDFCRLIVLFLFDVVLDQFRFCIRQIVIFLPFHSTILKPNLWQTTKDLRIKLKRSSLP